MKKIKLKIKFKKEYLKIILSKIIYYKRLLFIIFFGALLIFSFEIIYKCVFLNIKHVDYMENNNFIITNGKINNVHLNRVLRNINENEEKVKIEIKKEYKNPFSFNDVELLTELENDEEDENISDNNLE